MQCWRSGIIYLFRGRGELTMYLSFDIVLYQMVGF